MASLHRLTQVIAPSDYRGQGHVRRVASALALNGLVQVGGSGFGAVRQMPRDAANLVLGVACGEPPSRVGDAVKAFAGAQARSGNWQALERDICTTFEAIAKADSLGDALEAYVAGAADLILLNHRMIYEERPETSVRQASFAALRGLVFDIRVTLFRPQCTACIRLIDSTGDGWQQNVASVWFDAQRIYPLAEGGNDLSFNTEFGLALVAPVALALRDRDNDSDQAAVHPFAPSGGAAEVEGRGNCPAVGQAPIQGAQRRETRQAAALAGADDER